MIYGTVYMVQLSSNNCKMYIIVAEHQFHSIYKRKFYCNIKTERSCLRTFSD